MPYTSFHYHFRDVAERETRTLTIMQENDVVPKGSYGLLEMYCDDVNCDCRRVFLEIYDWERRKSMAFIAYGWESREFYRKWLRMDNPTMIREMQGPLLNEGSPQSKYAAAFLKLVMDVVLSDPAYIERLKRHYQIFKEKVDPQHFGKPGAGKQHISEKPRAKRRRRS